MGFWRFYLRLARDLPGVLWDAGNRLASILLMLAGVVVLFNHSLADKLIGWHGFSRVWAIAPLAALVLYGLAKANYDLAMRQSRTNAITPVPGAPTALRVGTVGTMNVYNVNVVQPPPTPGPPELPEPPPATQT